MYILLGILIPFIGTAIGSGLVFLINTKINDKFEKILLGFASGVMIAASIWSLLIPSINMTSNLNIKCLPACIGLMIGILFLVITDIYFPNIYNDNKIKKNNLMILAIVIHNIPEGLSVGVVFAGLLYGSPTITLASALSLSIGIAIQNIPEGLIVSAPLKSQGYTKKKAFIGGVLSGAVEPLASLITLFLAKYINILLPYLLSFAAGTMIYVVIEELVPEFHQGNNSKIGIISFTIGFLIMMALDISLN